APASSLWYGQRVGRALHHRGQQAHGSLAGLLALEVQELALALGHARQRVDCDAALLRELERGGGRRAVLAEGRADRRTLELDGLGRLCRGESAHQNGETARGRGRADRAAVQRA